MLLRLTTAAVLASLFTAVGAADDGASTPPPATQPGGPGAAVRWHYYTRCQDAELVAHEPQALWFRANLLLWRYDLKTRAMRSVSLLDGPLEEADKDAVLQPSGPLSLVNPLEFRDRIWMPGTGWTPYPGRSHIWDYYQVAFDPGGRLLSATGGPGGPRAVSVLADGQWKEIATVPYFRDGYLPAAGGYFLFGTFSGDGVPMFVDEQGRPKEGTPVGAAVYTRQMVRVGQTVYAVFKRAVNGETTWLVYEPVDMKLIERAAGPLVGIDLAGKGCFTGQIAASRNSQVRYRITLPDGQAVPTPWLRRGQAAVALRDANGDVWVGGLRWDGKDWQATVPIEHDFPLSSPFLAMDAGRAVLDAKRAWQEQPAGPGNGMAAWAPDSGTGWMLRADQMPYFFDLVRMDGPDKQVLFTHKTCRRSLDWLSVNGEWWWVDDQWEFSSDDKSVQRGERSVYRFKDSRLTKYPSKMFDTGGERGLLCLSPKGRVWLRDGAGWSVYDARVDHFVSADAGPWDEFAFRFGPWTLSRIGRHVDRVGSPWSSFEGQNIIYQKTPEGWTRFDPLKRGVVSGSPAMVRGDRMLVAYENVGVVEYAADRAGFVKLHDSWSLRPAYY